METRKIAGACFIGGALCALVALALSPNFWWLGALAGLSGGYLGYEFRETLRAIPVAWQETTGKGANTFNAVRCWLKDFLQEKHPFIYYAALLALPAMGWWWGLGDGGLGQRLVTILGAPFYYTEMVVLVGTVLRILVVLGSRREEWYWPFSPSSLGSDRTWQAIQKDLLQAKGFVEKPLTYRNFWGCLAIGAGVVLIAIFWTWWTKALQGLVVFSWNLIRLIHSQERYLCAIYGTLGGLTSYLVHSQWKCNT